MDIRHTGSKVDFVEDLCDLYVIRRQEIEKAITSGMDVESEDFPNHLTHLTVWRKSREFGGHEEGGWYYDSGEVEVTLRFHGERELRIYAGAVWDILFPRVAGSREYTSVLGGEDYRVDLTEGAGQAYPEEVPHYC
jgi:hypothetical protein